MKHRLKSKGEFFLLFLLFFIFYCFLQTKSIYGGDSGDLVTAAWVWGIPHPPGYPFYTLISSVLIHLLPFFTPAWRVGLISSFSSALSLAFFYILLLKTIKKKWASLLGTLVLAFLYPVWLYSEVAEVFSLNNLFTIVLTYLFLFILKNIKENIKKKKKQKNLILIKKTKRLIICFFFVLGLSLAHHHTIVLIFPAFFYLAFKNKKQILSFLKQNFKFRNKFKDKFKDKTRNKFKDNIFKNFSWFNWIILIFPFFLGFSFYLYPLLACRKAPLVCWDDPVNFKNLFDLITRADYGTFKSSTNLGNAPALRIYSLASFFRLAWEDFRFLGLFLIALGLFHSFKKYKDVFKLLAINLTVSLFFIFYASFILVNDFMVATFERFIILPYIFMTFSLALGVDFLFQQSQLLLKKFKIGVLSKNVFLTGFKLILFLLPLSFLFFNFRKISILKNDFTAENMAKDLLAPLPKQSILIVSSDTSVFDTQYVRYVLNYRDDVILISYPLLPAPYYQKAIKAKFPQLILSDKKDRMENLKEFVKANIDQYQVFVDRYSFDPREDWLPYGLSLQYLPQDQQPLAEVTMATNLELWNSFSDPFSGSLKDFENLFLGDVLRIYQNGRINFADFALKNDYLDQAEIFFKRAKELKPEYEDGDIGLGALYFKKGNCDQAQEYFLKAFALNENNPLLLGYLRKISLECFDDQEEAQKFENQCLQVKQGKPVKLTQ